MISGKDLIPMLESGAENWNAFRRRNPGGIMLNGASLADAQLSHADLRRAFLLESDLRGANLSFASLEGAILRQTNLHGSNLQHAKIDGADLCRADLSDADLRDASLAATFLKRANLRGADLSTASGLTHNQLVEAVGDDHTRLPENLARPSSWTA